MLVYSSSSSYGSSGSGSSNSKVSEVGLSLSCKNEMETIALRK